MKRMTMLLATLALTVSLVVVTSGTLAGGQEPQLHDQSDSVAFALNWPAPDTWGDVVYCGVATNAEPFELDVAVIAPALTEVDRKGNESIVTPGYENVGALTVGLHDHAASEELGYPRKIEYNVPSNGSFALHLTLGGRPDVDQLIQITSEPKGDPWKAGWDIEGFASVRANSDAVDPFDGDSRTDNYCLTIGLDSAVYAQGGTWEYTEGEISTTLPVPDEWVTDGDGSDGGYLRGFPH